MKKKYSFLVTVVLTFIFSMLVFPVVGNAQEQCAKIDFVANYADSDACFSTGDKPNPERAYYTDALENGTYFQVTAKHGAVVTFGNKENKMKETEPDYYDEAGNDVYLFYIPAKMIKSGGKRLVNAKLGSVETKLAVEAKKAEVTTHITKGTFDMTDKRYEYGKITQTSGSSSAYILWKVDDYSYCNNHLIQGKDILFVDENTTPNQWNSFMKPLVREGGTVYLSETFDHCSNIGYYHKAYSQIFSRYLVTDTSWTITTIGNIYKVGKVKIPAQKSAPKIKVDAVKGTLSTNSKMEYACRALNAENEAFGPWTAATSKQKITSVTNPSIVASGVALKVRIAGTAKQVPSASKTIIIPERGTIDLSRINLTGVSTNASIKISDFDASRKPYEYTMDTPNSSTVWKKMNKDGLVFKGKKALSDGTKIYIREKGVNENAKRGIFLKMPSSIAEITVSGAAVDWKKEAYDMTLFDK